MTLRVAFEDFAASAKKHTPGAPVYVSEHQGGAVVTAIDLAKNLVVVANGPISLEDATKRLKGEGLAVERGHWSGDDDEPDDDGALFVAAVAYRSREFQPGVWVDAFPYEPSRNEVLKAMYDEMVDSGDLKPVEFDEFVRLSLANVVVISPQALEGFSSAKTREP